MTIGRIISIFLTVFALSQAYFFDTDSFESESSGCLLRRFKQDYSIPGCVDFSIITYGCIGFCKSVAMSSNLATGNYKKNQPITSMGWCCNMMETEIVKVNVKCLDFETGEFKIEEKQFKSAKECSCYECKRNYKNLE